MLTNGELLSHPRSARRDTERQGHTVGDAFSLKLHGIGGEVLGMSYVCVVETVNIAVALVVQKEKLWVF